jgi:hypothetical protein
MSFGQTAGSLFASCTICQRVVKSGHRAQMVDRGGAGVGVALRALPCPAKPVVGRLPDGQLHWTEAIVKHAGRDR